MSRDFFYEYFVRPVYDPNVQGYNAVNSFVYFSILLLVAFFVVYPLLRHWKVRITRKFALALLPYILFGISLRAIVASSEAGRPILPFVRKTLIPWEPGFWMFTPGVWLLTFTVCIIGLKLALKYDSKQKRTFYRIFAGVGIAASLLPAALVLSHFQNWIGFATVLGVLAAAFFVIKALFMLLGRYRILGNGLNVLAVFGQAIDGLTTIVATTTYGFSEQHPVSAALLAIHPAAFVGVKLGLVLVILLFVEREIKEKELAGFIKLFILILGFATGGASVLKIGLI